jgi:hypothetical protein
MPCAAIRSQQSALRSAVCRSPPNRPPDLGAIISKHGKNIQDFFAETRAARSPVAVATCRTAAMLRTHAGSRRDPAANRQPAIRNLQRRKPKASRDFRDGAIVCRLSRRADSNLQTAGTRNERATLTSRKIALEVKVASDTVRCVFQHRYAWRFSLCGLPIFVVRTSGART